MATRKIKLKDQLGRVIRVPVAGAAPAGSTGVSTGAGGSGSGSTGSTSTATPTTTTPPKPSPAATVWKLIREVPANLQKLAALAGSGFAVRDASGDWHQRGIAVEPGELTVTNGDGASGDPQLGLADVTPTSGGSVKRVAFDAKGRRSEEASATTDDLSEGTGNLYFTAARMAAATHAATNKTTPADADEFAGVNSADSYAPLRFTWANIKTALNAIYVRGPASATNNATALFDGTTGKLLKAGPALGTFATADYGAAPFINRLQDSGRFDGGAAGLGLPVNVANFNKGAMYSQMLNGCAATAVGKFIHDNTDFGGTAGNMVPTIVDLINATGRPAAAGDARYGAEFIVMQLTSGSGTTLPFSFPWGTSYLMTGNGFEAIYGADGYCTYTAWLRAIDGTISIGQSSRMRLWKNGVQQGGLDAKLALEPADGWVHIRIVDRVLRGYSSAFPFFCAADAGVGLQVALPVLAFGYHDPGLHAAPIIGPHFL